VFDRSRRDDEGFSLIELAVVILIIGILLAIAIPTFLGVRERSQNRKVQTELRNSFVTTRVDEIPTEIYTQNVASLTALEGSVLWEQGSTPVQSGRVYVVIQQALSNPDTGKEIYLSGRSESGTCFYLHHDSGNNRAVEFSSDGACGAADAQTYGKSW
jgi:type IV pilus assembly protein PilA